jgi:DNA-binding response OmpR family regulator
MSKLLIVEDDPTLGRMYEKALVRAGFEAELVPTAIDALTALSAHRTDLVLLDVMLSGGKNGFDLLEDMKANPNFRDIPVIICTNLDSEKDSALKAGAADYFIKSNTPVEQLVEKIKSILG